MTTISAPVPERNTAPLPPMLGGFAALAESAWMGLAQASEFLEPVRQALPRLKSAAAGAGASTAGFLVSRADDRRRPPSC